MLIHLNKYFSNIKRQMQQRVNDIKLLIENTINYSFFQLGDAFLSANLFVILFKFYWAIGGIKPTIGINLSILFCFFLLSLELEIAIKMRNKIKEKAPKLLGNSFVFSELIFDNPSIKYQTHIKYLTHVSYITNLDFEINRKWVIWRNILFQMLFLMLIWFRLIILCEPLFFFIFNICFSSMLITNQHFLSVSLYSFTLWLSRIIFFISDQSLSIFRKNISEVFITLEENYTLKPTWLNVKILSAYIFHENDDFELSPMFYQTFGNKLEVIGICHKDFAPWFNLYKRKENDKINSFLIDFKEEYYEINYMTLSGFKNILKKIKKWIL